MARKIVKIIPIIFFLGILLAQTIPIYAQEDTETAEIVAFINVPDNKIPAIKTANWTTINIIVNDVFGIPWGRLSELPFFKYYGALIPAWRPLLGYTSLQFEPEIIKGDPRGWFVEVTPTVITNADQGKKYPLTLRVKTDDIAVDYSVVVGIKTTRKDIYGNPIGETYITIPVKASSLNNVKMTSQSVSLTKELSPHTYGYFDITVENLGYYRDMFQLKFVTEKNFIIEASQQLFVINPGESQTVRIEFLTPETFYDIGTPNTIGLYVVSASDPNPQLIGSLVVTTKGIYVSPLVGIIAVPIIVLIILLYLFFFYLRERKNREFYGKPQKPWTIPEERQYLEELKQEDKKIYEKERQMMEDEYESAMLWYKCYRDAMKRESKKPPVIEEKPKRFRKKTEPVQKQEEKKENTMKRFFKRSEKPVEKKEIIEKPVEAITEPKPIVPKPVEERDKEKTLQRIQREQEKQKKRLKK